MNTHNIMFFSWWNNIYLVTYLYLDLCTLYIDYWCTQMGLFKFLDGYGRKLTLKPSITTAADNTLIFFFS